MTEETGAPEGAAEPTVAPDAPQADQQPQQQEPEARPFEARPDASVRRAFEAFDKTQEAEPKEEAEAKTEEGPARDEHGRFVAKDGQEPQKPPETDEKPQEQEQKPEAKSGPDEPPSRFSADAKAEWEKAPPSVRAEINRAVREMESGIEQYRQQVEPLKPFMDLAQQHGTTVDQALQHYVGLEQLLAKDPIKGFDQIARNMGTSLQDVARQVLGQQEAEANKPAEQRQYEQRIDGLQQHIARLEQQLGGVNQTIQSQQQSQTLAQVEAFAQQNPRFDELSEEIAQMLSTGYARDLQDAYDKADRLNPAPPPAAPAAPDPAPAQTRKPSLSVSGAPGTGSNPAHRQPPSNARDAVRRALTQAG